jgi:hypothetical protein
MIGLYFFNITTIAKSQDVALVRIEGASGAAIVGLAAVYPGG